MGFLDWLLRRSPSDPRRTTTFAFRRKLIDWLLITEIREAREFLENHLELLRPESEPLLAMAIHHLPKKSASSLIKMAEVNKVILHQAINMGRTPQAVRDAYIDEFNALTVLDIPSWLSTINTGIIAMILLSSVNDSAGTDVQKPEINLKVLLQEAIAKVQNADDLEPEILANLQLMLGGQMTEENSSWAIEVLTNAAMIFEVQRFPHKFAQIQGLLGQSYFNEFLKSSDEEDVFRAILCFEASLAYFTPEKDMEEWAQQMIHLSRCYGAMADYEQAQQNLNEVASKLSSSSFSDLTEAVQKMRNKLEESLQEQEDRLNMFELEVPEVVMRIRDELHQDLERRRARLHTMRLAHVSDSQANSR